MCAVHSCVAAGSPASHQPLKAHPTCFRNDRLTGACSITQEQVAHILYTSESGTSALGPLFEYHQPWFTYRAVTVLLTVITAVSEAGRTSRRYCAAHALCMRSEQIRNAVRQEEQAHEMGQDAS